MMSFQRKIPIPVRFLDYSSFVSFSEVLPVQHLASTSESIEKTVYSSTSLQSKTESLPPPTTTDLLTHFKRKEEETENINFKQNCLLESFFKDKRLQPIDLIITNVSIFAAYDTIPSTDSTAITSKVLSKESFSLRQEVSTYNTFFSRSRICFLYNLSSKQ